MKANLIGKSEKNMSESVLVVTEKDYEQMQAAGINDESLLNPGTYKLRRRNRIATKEELHPSNTKVQITIKIDLDVLNYFKERASQSNAAPYQTQINNELRTIMENAENKLAPTVKPKKAKNFKDELLKDKEFIKAFAEKLKKVA